MSNSTVVTLAEYESILREDFTTFIERSFLELNPHGAFQCGQYIELLAATLDLCRTGKTKRLIINLPPRTLKSHAASVAFPAWLLGHDPTVQIICASYGQDLADKHSRDCRTLMGSSFYRGLFPGTVLSDVKQSVNDFVTTAQGFRMSTSVGGVLTGRGADVIILDDILKPEDALSESRRKAANEWYFSTLLSRLNSKEHGVIILVMQRLHQDDLVGEVLDRGGEWKVLTLPAIALDDEVYSYESLFGKGTFVRKAGEALHPERDSIETYRKVREAIGEYNFQSQYQQSPLSREGGVVNRDWLRFYEADPVRDTRSYCLQSWDTACKVGDNNDYSVCTTWELRESGFYLIDVFRKRVTFPQLKRHAVELFQKFDPLKVVIEDQASGTALIQEIKSEGVYCVEPYKPAPNSDKLMRFAAQSIKFESGKVFLPTEAPWLAEYVSEITGFPGSKHDDQVDSTSQALELMNSMANTFAFFSALARYPWNGRLYES